MGEGFRPEALCCTNADSSGATIPGGDCYARRAGALTEYFLPRRLPSPREGANRETGASEHHELLGRHLMGCTERLSDCALGLSEDRFAVSAPKGLLVETLP